MHLREIGRYVVVHTPAKLNLFFEVLDRRSDGFHEVETLVYPVDLCDTLVITQRPDERVTFRLVSAPQGAVSDRASLGNVPADSSNLVIRAIDLLRRSEGCSLGADVLLVKRIPSEAGLGGGSSDAAAALAAANVAWNLKMPSEQLAEIGAGLGSDIPLFFRAGASICRGRGEIVESASVSPVLHFALVRPPVGLSTAAVYGACRVSRKPRSLPHFLEAFTSAHLGRIGDSLFNRLESAASELTPWIARTRQAFESLDCAGHQMTGSGSCYFGLCRHGRHARRVARRLESYGIGKAYAVRGYR
jgi:4-diphosphocytidyl-2-C-methyl-D-erythritol kinase